MKKIYSFYKERLIEISGRSRSLYSKKISKKNAFDIGRLLSGDNDAIRVFEEFLFNRKVTSYPLINKNAKARIMTNLTPAEVAVKLPIQKLVGDLKTLQREIEEFASETGRYELSIGYPFVEGSIGKDIIVRAPLLLFPATIKVESETEVIIEKKANEPIQLNKVFLLAYAQRHKLNIEIDELITQFEKLESIDEVFKYLDKIGVKVTTRSHGMLNFSSAKEPGKGDRLSIRNYVVIGRFPLANAIYNDYKLLETRKVTDAIRELLANTAVKKIKKPSTDLYAISTLDFSQEEAIEKLNQKGNMVIYGPPGTGKSQTIVNIITDALCKNKRILVVSQKKAALDVVYNRLGSLNERVMYINDPEKNKAEFFLRTRGTHNAIMESPPASPRENETKYAQTRGAIGHEIGLLRNISDTLFTPTSFGLSLQEMYMKSGTFGKSTFDRNIYQQMQRHPKLLSYKYPTLSNIIRIISEKKKDDLYHQKMELAIQNPLAAHVRSDLDVNTINTAKSLVEKILGERKLVPFDKSSFPNSRQLLAFYLENGLGTEQELRPVVQLVAKIERRPTTQVRDNFQNALFGLRRFIDKYSFLEQTLSKQGFAMIVDGLVHGNREYIRMLDDALGNYAHIRGLNLNFKELSRDEADILRFCYDNSKSFAEFKKVVDKILPARVYHEAVLVEEQKQTQLARIMDFESIKNRIISLKKDQKEIVRDLCLDMFKQKYTTLYNSNLENKNFLYQINKDKNFMPTRKFMELYSDLMLTMFPCWLLSPESVSTIMPLEEGMFDLVLFDEASQVFIENTIPTIYRSKHIAVAGDNKQLRPTALFMRRYMGSDQDELDQSAQAALEVESLLDLAISRYNTVNLNYHYRSLNEELITFSNHAFYDGKLQIAPNLTKNSTSKPIERIKVNGQWIDRKNKAEAAEVVELLKRILKTRKKQETIGIITFNAEQENYIEDQIDKAGRTDDKFREAVAKERARRHDGESVGLFVKNLENVQGDERDIIIFSTGYGKNEQGKVIASFGSLNTEGGENRLNVAITRAKKKIYLVTSIEPEELNIENTKNAGPKIFRKYLEYARAVSKGKSDEVELILDSLKPAEQTQQRQNISDMARQLKAELEKLGHTVELNLGSNNYKLSLAIYDKKLDRFLVGVEFDDVAYRSSASVVERDVFRSAFMESRGWTILRVWSRDFWLNPAKVVDRIDAAAKVSRASLGK